MNNSKFFIDSKTKKLYLSASNGAKLLKFHNSNKATEKVQSLKNGKLTIKPVTFKNKNNLTYGYVVKAGNGAVIAESYNKYTTKYSLNKAMTRVATSITNAAVTL